VVANVAAVEETCSESAFSMDPFVITFKIQTSCVREVLNTFIWFILTLSWSPKQKPTMGTVDAEVKVTAAYNL